MNFYHMWNDHRFKHIDYALDTDWKSIKCPRYKGHQRNGDRVGTLKIDIPSKTTGDFLWTFLSECIITDKIAKILHENKITGYKLKPVEVNKAKIKLSYKLWEFTVTGKGGDADKKSGISLKEKCDYCGLKIYSGFKHGIIVNERTWDGSDVFTVVGYPRIILVAEKVKELIISNELTGARLIPSNELK